MDIEETTEPPVDDKERFIMDLEFVQALANPEYLMFLAQHPKKYLEEPEFITYLEHLLYWKKPEYAKFIMYPHCLHFLDLLQDETFRKQLVNPYITNFIGQQQTWHWQHYTKNRNKEQQRTGI